MEEHLIYMKRCLQLAANGLGSVSPNPMVGAVVVYRNRIIGEGWHRRYGGPHAEVNAIGEVLQNYPEAEEMLQESVLYVSLEPCSHQGRTPPCSDLIIRHRLPKVVIGCQDPHEKVNGKGIEKLRHAGVELVLGVMEKE
ncbi:MAG TPA: bifunctional diaminohydroxyphosphoribosylaminopyrimidine deaminase/5-amino-6-(5-phosphoribosylamino)uracil reductase RibD, partial [Anseongella sp.]|nr:bifunctional diaminohydroxyphosphoribosylaminopyrimidine deaminase/5-amino-6-(5-phosphoribosylamino)uracil reductase RibD [Anseongella sp.]